MISPEEAEVIYERLHRANLCMNYYEFSTGEMQVESTDGVKYTYRDIASMKVFHQELNDEPAASS